MSMERPVCSSHAQVMIYDDQMRKWLPAENMSGVARVQIYQHTQNSTFRVVGRIVQDNTVVINSAILKGLKYNQATPTFHQWRDTRHVYGLNFQSANDADEFASSMMGALDTLSQAAPSRPPQAAPLPPVPNGPAQTDRSYSQQQKQQDPPKRSIIENTSVPASRPSPPEPPSGPPAVPKPPPTLPQAPQAPPAPPQPPAAPPAPAAPAPPAAPPAPPSGGGGGVPPPPPPPPMGGPSGGGGGGAPAAGGGLAAALAAAKLKKVTRDENSDAGASTQNKRPAPAGGGGVDIMEEIKKKIEKRKQASEAPSGRTSPPGGAAKTEQKKIWEKPSKPNGVESSSTASASPQFNRRKVSNAQINGNGGGDNSMDYEKLKQEILSEMRKELQKTKQEIIDAIKLELSRR